MAALLAGAALSVGGGLYGSKKDQDMMGRMKQAREKALANMRRLWRHAYAQSQGEFDQARTDIMNQGQSNMGSLTAGLAGSGLLNTTVAPNLGRGVQQSTQDALGRLGAQRASSEYGKWMDFANLKGQTAYDNFAPSSQAESWGQIGGYAGQALGGVNWGSLFGSNGGGSAGQYAPGQGGGLPWGMGKIG